MKHPSSNNSTDIETLLRQLKTNSQASLQAADGSITDGIAGWVAAQYTTSTHQELAAVGGSRRWKILRDVIRDWSVLRRNDHAALRLQLERERLQFEQEKHRQVVAAGRQKPLKEPDYKRPLTDEERLAIVAKVDEILGLKPQVPPVRRARSKK